MGEAMSCCGKDEEDTNDFKTDLPFAKDLGSPDKIRMIVKIQSLFRGFKARQRVRRIRSSGGQQSMMDKLGGSPGGPANYDNQEVMVSLRLLTQLSANSLTTRRL